MNAPVKLTAARNVHNIHHFTNFVVRVDVYEICDHAADFREYVVVETDAKRGDTRRREVFACKDYFDLSPADSLARPLAREWQRAALAASKEGDR